MLNSDRLALRPTEAADLIGVSRSTMYGLIAARAIPSVKIGGCTRLPLDALKAWINGQVKEQSERR